MAEMLSVTAINNGMVIDHIPAGQAINIAQLLQLSKHRKRITLGLNLSSNTMGLKDLIKIENRQLTAEELAQVAVFAPQGIVNIIENYNVIEKIKLQPPTSISKIFTCPNQLCITHTEPVNSDFYLVHQNQTIQLTCKYCERNFTQGST